MKTLVFSLAFLSLLLFGCENNSITGPVSPGQIDKTNEAIGNSFTGIIPLHKVLTVPGPGATVRNYNLVGKIDFNGEYSGISPNQTNEAEDLKLEIIVDAQLSSASTKDPYQNKWMISSESQDRFYVNPEGEKVFERTYPVLHRKDNMQLVCTFIVTTRGLSVDDIALKIPNDQRT